MKKLFKLAIAAIVMAYVLPTTVMAGEGYRGFSIGVIGGSTDFTTKGREEEKGTTNNADNVEDFNVTSITKSIDIGSVFVEYSFGEVIGWTIGLEHIPGAHVIGTKTRTDTDSAASALDDDGTRTGKAEVEDLTTIYFEPAIMLNDYIGIYAKAGVQHLTVNTLEKNLPTSSYGNKEIWGGVYGGGVKVVSPWGLFLKVEGTKNIYPTVDFQSTTGNKNIIKAKPESESVRFALGYNF